MCCLCVRQGQRQKRCLRFENICFLQSGGKRSRRDKEADGAASTASPSSVLFQRMALTKPTWRHHLSASGRNPDVAAHGDHHLLRDALLLYLTVPPL